MSSENIEWYEVVTAGDSVNAVARKSGLVQTTLAAQVRKKELTPQSIVAVARAYGKDPLEALVIAGFLTSEEVDSYARRAALTDASDAELAREVWERMASGQATPPITESRNDPDLPDLSPSQYALAARRMRSRGKALRAELDALGEESQDEEE